MSLLHLVEALGRGSVVVQGSPQGLFFGGTDLASRGLVLEGLLAGLLGSRHIAGGRGAAGEHGARVGFELRGRPRLRTWELLLGPRVGQVNPLRGGVDVGPERLELDPGSKVSPLR